MNFVLWNKLQQYSMQLWIDFMRNFQTNPTWMNYLTNTLVIISWFSLANMSYLIKCAFFNKTHFLYYFWNGIHFIQKKDMLYVSYVNEKRHTISYGKFYWELGYWSFFHQSQYFTIFHMQKERLAFLKKSITFIIMKLYLFYPKKDILI